MKEKDLIVNKNKFLGECIIPQKEKGKVKIDGSYKVVINYIILLTFKLIDSNKNNKINIKRNILSKEEIEN